MTHFSRPIAGLLAVAMLAFAAPGRDEALNRLTRTALGQPVRIRLADRTVVEGRLAAADRSTLRLQVVAQGALVEREIPLTEIRTFREIKESEFGGHVKRGFGVTLGVAAVFVVVSLVGALIGAATN